MKNKKNTPLLERCECGKKPSHIKGELDLWWLFWQTVGWNNEWNKEIKYVALCPDLFCNYSAIAYNGQPSPKLVKHLEMWQPQLIWLAQEIRQLPLSFEREAVEGAEVSETRTADGPVAPRHY